MESGILKSSIHCILTEVLQKKKDHCLLCDSARPYIAHTVWTVCTDYRWEALPHSAYNPDFHLFPKLKELLCGGQ